MPNMPKMPKLHKPAFLKKKKTDGDAVPDAEGDAPAEGMYTKVQEISEQRRVLRRVLGLCVTCLELNNGAKLWIFS